MILALIISDIEYSRIIIYLLYSTISEVLKNKDQLEIFKNYLFKRNTTTEIPLEFLKAMEDAKSSADKETKLQDIYRFLKNNDNCESVSDVLHYIHYYNIIHIYHIYRKLGLFAC